MKKKIIIFGGSGFIGTNLINKFKKYNFDITSASKTKPLKKKFNEKVKYIKCDITNYKNLKKIKSNYDFIINLSGNDNHQNKSETFKLHSKGSENLLKFFKDQNFSKFIQVGSSLEYGNLKSPHKEQKKISPNSYFGKAKAKASKMLMNKFSKKKSLIILRLYQIYGPFQKEDKLIPYTIKASLKNNKFNCSNGEQYRDFLYIDDLTNLFLKIIRSKKQKNGIFNVGSGKPHKVKNVIEKITYFTKKGKPIFGAIKMRKEEMKVYYPDIKKIKLAYKWTPQISLIKGLKKTIKFYEKK